MKILVSILFVLVCLDIGFSHYINGQRLALTDIQREAAFISTIDLTQFNAAAADSLTDNQKQKIFSRQLAIFDNLFRNLQKLQLDKKFAQGVKAFIEANANKRDFRQLLAELDMAIEQKLTSQELILNLIHGITLLWALLVLIKALSKKKQAVPEKSLSNDMLTTLNSITDGVISTDISGNVRFMNPVSEKMLGVKHKDVIGKHINSIFKVMDEETDKTVISDIDKFFSGAPENTQTRHKSLFSPDGIKMTIEETVAPIRAADNSIIGAVLVIRDMSSNFELSRKLTYQESHDQLTGLINRTEFERILSLEIIRAKTSGIHSVVLYLDLDQFKIVNDTAGHFAGDELLRQVSDLILSNLGERDYLSRLGGDEFGILCSDSSMEEALQRADTIRQAIADYQYDWDGQYFKLGVSIGVRSLDKHVKDAAEIMSQVDTACYAAKEQGRNAVHLYNPDNTLLRTRKSEMYWSNAALDAIKKDRIVLFAQLISPISLKPSVIWYEILVRLKDEAGNIVYPDSFVPALERFGGITELDFAVIRHSLAFLANHPNVRLNINLSGQTIGDVSLTDFIKKQFHITGVKPSRVVFEITETASVTNLPVARKFIQEMRSLGCRLALDDFGSGMSSFGYLKTLDVDYIKLDGSFVRDIDRDPIHYSMVDSVNQVARIMGKKTIAEFVEDNDVLLTLKRIGIDFGQGYHFHKPQPLHEIVFD